MICRTVIAALALAATCTLGAAAAVASTLEPPNAPSGFHGDVIGPFGWTDNSDNEDGFRVYIQQPDMEPRLAAEFPADTISGTVSYTFEENCNSMIWVVAYNTAGESAPSNTEQLSPPPSNCPATVQETYTNDGDQTASGLSISQLHALQGIRLITNAPGCDPPAIDGNASPVTVTWGSACVDPGESVVLELDLLSPIFTGIPEWTHPEAATTPTPTPSPTPAATPTMTPAGFPNSGNRTGGGSLPLAWVGLAIAGVGVLLLVRGGIAHRE